MLLPADQYTPPPPPQGNDRPAERKRLPNHTGCAEIARRAQAEFVAAHLWWAINEGWPALPSTSTIDITLWDGETVSLGRSGHAERASERDRGYPDGPGRINPKARTFTIDGRDQDGKDFHAVITMRLDLWKSDFHERFRHASDWVRRHVNEYLERRPVAVRSLRHPYERQNPDRHLPPEKAGEGPRPLFIAPPDLNHRQYASQMAAWMQFLTDLGTACRLEIEYRDGLALQSKNPLQ
jgi:hypothetical protein